MNMFIHELKQYWKSLTIWSVSLAALMYLSVGKFSGLSASGEDMDKLMDSMPKAMKAMLGGDLSIGTVEGYYGVCFVLVILMAGIHAVLLGAGIIAKEEQEKTSEFLFVKPITRVQAITAKLSAAIFNILVFNIVSFVCGTLFYLGHSETEDKLGEMLMLHVGMLLTQFVFMAIGMVIAGLNKSGRKAGSYSIGVLLGMYVLSVFVGMSDKIEFLKYLTPFKYFEPATIINGSSFGIAYYLISIIIIVGGLVGTFVFYNRRDLQV